MNLFKLRKNQFRVFFVTLLTGCFIIAESVNVCAQTQTISVTGNVKDQSGMTIIGATIVEKRSIVNGTITDIDGNYQIKVSKDAVLIASFIGYKNQEVPVNGKSVINFVFEKETVGLNEVIAIGYGTQKKGDLTNAVAVMSAEKLNERPVTKVDQALIGQMAGVRVQQTSGLPGKGLSIQIRGTGSITANNEPLYVIDGFPMEASSQSSSGSYSSGNPLSSLNPNDIESIQVLKDAAAASIYGSRGSNGVVIITTKQGKSGKPQISFNTYTGWSETAKKLDVLNSEEWIDRAKEHMNYAWVNAGLGSSSDTNEERRQILGLATGQYNTKYMWDDRWDQAGHPGLDYVDWQDLFFRKGQVQSYQLSAKGGTDVVKYYVSADYLDQEGVAIGVNYKRYSARANIEVKPNEKLRFGLNIAPSFTDYRDPGVEGKDALTHIVVSMAPVVESSTGAEGTNVGDNAKYAWGTSRVSPIAAAKNIENKNQTFRAITTTYLEYELLKGLKFKTNLNFDIHDNEYYRYTPSYVTRNRTASATKSGYTRKNFVTENTINYNTSFGKHNIDLLGGQSFSSFNLSTYKISGTDFASDEVVTISTTNTTSGSTSEVKATLYSYFGRAQYSYSNKYFLQASIRRDGSSKFGDDTKYGYFPSASLGWKISEENFMDNLDVISNLKLRTSWGLAGNNGIGDYKHIALLANSNYSYGGNNGSLVNGLTPDNYPNPDLSWETSETIDVGIDIGVLSNRITASFDYYTKRNTDLLLSIDVPSASGFTSALTNIGEVLNKGWEFEVNSRNTIGEFKWQTQFNLSHNSNKVKKLGADNSPIYGGSYDITHNILEVGKPLYTLYLVQQDGLLTSADVANGVAMYGSQEAGDPKYVDQNDDGTIDSDDRTYSGHPNPDFVWGITNNFSYKGFDLSVLIQGQWGGVIYSTFGRGVYRTGMGGTENTLGLSRNRIRWEENQVLTEADAAGKERKSPSSFGRIKNTDWLYKNDYWRIRNITLGYDLGQLIKSNIISGARVYVTAENWFGADKYDGGFNPEAVNNNGDDYGAFPLSKSMVIGFNFKF